ncbi:MAG: patatin-like phospholipase family protein [Devosia sp.]
MQSRNTYAPLRFGLVAIALLVLTACSTLAPRNPVPLHLADDATIQADQRLRYWGDDGELAKIQAAIAPGSNGDVDYLTLSGGGSNGAYGVGFLAGWSARGNRPEFEVVTGISVGAIIAPLAFLGPAYDDKLRQAMAMLVKTPKSAGGLLSVAFGGSSMISNSTVRQAIESIIDDRVLAAIGEAHKKGRRVYVGTTNLDAQRPMIWDIGAIAISNLPHKLDLVHEIILASAAVPGIFPPVLLEVDAAGQRYSELHVDGGVTEQVVLMPGGYEAFVKNRRGVQKLYVIYNGVTAASPAAVDASGLSLLERSVPTLLKYLGRSNIEQLANAARNVGLLFRLTAMPVDFPEASGFFGDPAWISALYDEGFKNGRAGDWEER